MTQWLGKLTESLPLVERRPPPRASAGAGLGLIGLGLGAGLMYFFDPERGARRRAEVRRGLELLARRTGDALDGASRKIIKPDRPNRQGVRPVE